MGHWKFQTASGHVAHALMRAVSTLVSLPRGASRHPQGYPERSDYHADEALRDGRCMKNRAPTTPALAFLILGVSLFLSVPTVLRTLDEGILSSGGLKAAGLVLCGSMSLLGGLALWMGWKLAWTRRLAFGLFALTAICFVRMVLAALYPSDLDPSGTNLVSQGLGTAIGYLLAGVYSLGSGLALLALKAVIEWLRKRTD